MDFKCTHCGRWNRFTILRESAGIAEVACAACGRMMALGVAAFSDRDRAERLQTRAASQGLDLVHVPYGGTLKRGLGYSLHRKGGGDERRVAGGRSGTLDDIEGYLDGNAPRSTRTTQGVTR